MSHEKYLKYKNKYLELKYNIQQQGGAKINDHVYESNTRKYLGKITSFTNNSYQYENSNGIIYNLSPSEENKSWYVPKLSEEIDNMFKERKGTFTEGNPNSYTPREVIIPLSSFEPKKAKSVPNHPPPQGADLMGTKYVPKLSEEIDNMFKERKGTFTEGNPNSYTPREREEAIQLLNFEPPRRYMPNLDKVYNVPPYPHQPLRDNTFDDYRQKELDDLRAELLRCNQKISQLESKTDKIKEDVSKSYKFYKEDGRLYKYYDNKF
jgi:hypothetical protein